MQIGNVKNYGVFLTMVAISFASCNQGKGKADGGPCTYDRKVLPATLLQLQEINKNEYDAVLLVKRNEGAADTVYYSGMNNHHYIDREKIPRDSLVVGLDYQYIRQKIITGHCNPDVDLLILEPFTNAVKPE